jgi:uncharacterized protein
VFAWHARPGAFLRLSPPWQPMRVITEADSLQNGRAELALVHVPGCGVSSGVSVPM